MFVSLRHRPGHAQADFGEARVVIRDVEQKAYFFALDLPHSDACYVRVHPAANTEAWLAGHVHAFAFFGALLQSVLYDNDRCLVAKITPDGTRNRTQRFSAMLSHYVIQDRYGRRGKGNDKGKEEGSRGIRARTSWCQCRTLQVGPRSTIISKSNVASGKLTSFAAIRSSPATCHSKNELKPSAQND